GGEVIGQRDVGPQILPTNTQVLGHHASDPRFGRRVRARTPLCMHAPLLLLPWRTSAQGVRCGGEVGAYDWPDALRRTGGDSTIHFLRQVECPVASQNRVPPRSACERRTRLAFPELRVSYWCDGARTVLQRPAHLRLGCFHRRRARR